MLLWEAVNGGINKFHHQSGSKLLLRLAFSLFQPNFPNIALRPRLSSLCRFRSSAAWCTATTASMSRWCHGPRCPSSKVAPTSFSTNGTTSRRYLWTGGRPMTPTSPRTRWASTGRADRSAPSPAPVSYEILPLRPPCSHFLSVSSSPTLTSSALRSPSAAVSVKPPRRRSSR